MEAWISRCPPGRNTIVNTPRRLFRCVCNRCLQYAASRKTARRHCASCGKEQMFRLSDALPWHRQARRLQHKTAGSGRTARLWSLVNSKTVELAVLLKWRLPQPHSGRVAAAGHVLLLTSCCSNFWMKTRSVRPLSPQYLSDWRETCSHIQVNSHSASPRAPIHHITTAVTTVPTLARPSYCLRSSWTTTWQSRRTLLCIPHIASRAYSSP